MISGICLKAESPSVALFNIWMTIVLIDANSKTSTPLWEDIEQDKKSFPLCRGKEWKHVLSGANGHKMSRRYEKID